MMTVIVNSKIKKSDVEKIYLRLESNITFDAHKHAGKIVLKKDPIQIQKEMRDEWQ